MLTRFVWQNNNAYLFIKHRLSLSKEARLHKKRESRANVFFFFASTDVNTQQQVFFSVEQILFFF